MNTIQIPVFQSAYFPPIQQFAHFTKFDKVFIEQNDTYSKQTFRNRLQIAGPNGLQNLSIPVEKPFGSKTKMKDIIIKDSIDWQDNIFKSIQTAYKNSPFYEYYIDDFMPFFEQKYNKLIDLNIDILNKILESLEIECQVVLTDKYATNYQLDNREIVHPKPQFRISDPSFNQKQYHQLFEEKYGFLPNLSILDLIFNEGPLSYFYLKNSIK
ncbi:MAG: hypothetical protein C0599_16395 [Salinivirgaceae bacterium]|nr:MAG: hypothetical protein C0599_16395 [Salinivirgaceae bacterium]